MKEIAGNNCQDAWKNACNHLILKNRSDYNLVVSVENPTESNDSWGKEINPSNISIGSSRGDNFNDVVHTIFPIRFLEKFDTRDELYAYYLKTHFRTSRLGSKKYSNWGTYFLRLICFEKSKFLKEIINPRQSLAEILDIYNNNLKKYNQIERVIYALGSWRIKSKASIYCHTTSPVLDSLKIRNTPCLQFIEFLQERNNEVDMVVIYRNHDYFNKAFANFVGLGQLLKFVCSHCNKTPGKLICHSVRAYFDVSNKKMVELLALEN